MVWRNVYGPLEQEVVKPPPQLESSRANHVDAVRAWPITHVLEPIDPAVPRLLTR